MSCELNIISIFLLSVVVLISPNCPCFGAISELEPTGSSRESAFDKELFNFTDENLRSPQSDAIESHSTNQPLNLDVSVDSFEVTNNQTDALEKDKQLFEALSNDDASVYTSRALGSFHDRVFDIKTRGDSPVSGEGGVDGKVMYGTNRWPDSKLPNLRIPLPLIHCSKEVMILKVPGRENPNIFVDREDAAPLPLLHVPAYCGISVAFAWKHVVLTIPYDGCFVTRENGSYVLSLLWWGRPVQLTCPMKPVMLRPSLSFLCSRFGVVLQLEGAKETPRKHQVKVNGKIKTLVSESCASILNSPSEALLLHIAFNAECWTAKDEKRVLVVFLEGRKFSISCSSSHFQSQYHPYFESVKPDVEETSSFQRLSNPSSIESSKQTENSQHSYEPRGRSGFQNPSSQHPFYPRPNVYQKKPSSFFSPLNPAQQMPPYPMMPPYLPYPVTCPPYPKEFCSWYSIPDNPSMYQEPAVPTYSQPGYKPVPWAPFIPPTSKPTDPPVYQDSLIGQRPIFSQSASEEPSKLSPSLNCARNRLTATLPSASMDSLKVKDLQTNTWIFVASVLDRCDYKLYHRNGNLVFLSPLPACHTTQTSATVISLFIRFWDSSEQRYRTLQLQCQYSEDKSPQSAVPLPPIKSFHQGMPDLSQIPSQFEVLCSSHHMVVKLPPGLTSEHSVQDPQSETQAEAVPILEAPIHCGYSVSLDNNKTVGVLLPYSSCHMRQKDGQYQIILRFQTARGRTVESLLSCQAALSQECDVAPEEQLMCGSGRISSTECNRRGCCYSMTTQSCFYPMDECTKDRHLVFSIRSSSMDPPLSPSTLITAGNSPCEPEVVTEDVALFKIPLDECGVHRYEVGKTVVYMVEVLNRLQPITLNYGTITRESPVRMVVECRYLPGSLVSVGYLVKSPSLGPSIRAQGVFGVQLRIAKDEHYNDFYPQYHQPLRMLLGKPLHLEVRLLNPPDPSALLLVHYCVAYPRSANSAWILIYDGCPNYLDKTPTHTFHALVPQSQSNHVRRFTITTFQFLSDDSSLEENEEIYFMCSTEVCLPSEGPCVEGCFTGPSDLKS